MRSRVLRLATYNIHRGVGDDGLYDLERIARVLKLLDVDVVGLQEVDIGHSPSGQCQSRFLAGELGYVSVEGPLLERHIGWYGNALLSRLPVREATHIDLSVPGREPRGALEVTLGEDAFQLHVMTMHLGLQAAERRRQVERLLAEARTFDRERVVVMGDTNEWIPGNAIVAQLDRKLGRTRHRRSFPTRLPLLPLDRIWVHPRRLLRHLEVYRTPLTRYASDHYPVVAEIARE